MLNTSLPLGDFFFACNQQRCPEAFGQSSRWVGGTTVCRGRLAGEAEVPIRGHGSLGHGSGGAVRIPEKKPWLAILVGLEMLGSR